MVENVFLVNNNLTLCTIIVYDRGQTCTVVLYQVSTLLSRCRSPPELWRFESVTRQHWLHRTTQIFCIVEIWKLAWPLKKLGMLFTKSQWHAWRLNLVWVQCCHCWKEVLAQTVVMHGPVYSFLNIGLYVFLSPLEKNSPNTVYRFCPIVCTTHHFFICHCWLSICKK